MQSGRFEETNSRWNSSKTHRGWIAGAGGMRSEVFDRWWTGVVKHVKGDIQLVV
ncbi:hypothetical protein RSSM_01959 [Rhodopirellula sallentina SM41]|uniref:Uncharacterized protein n=1 Tax=Rhodopirellula sallentina SM41 TaxID=1263870 RepID=M5UFJ8_9BACT|nr:hypothetical protein RSSM_01959 [Rhodopirellula sallentina SM41]